jgi:hypothetical protein
MSQSIGAVCCSSAVGSVCCSGFALIYCTDVHIPAQICATGQSLAFPASLNKQLRRAHWRVTCELGSSAGYHMGHAGNIAPKCWLTTYLRRSENDKELTERAADTEKLIVGSNST